MWRLELALPLPPGDQIDFERHAQDRMRERGTAEEQVRAVLEDPDVMRPAPVKQPSPIANGINGDARN